MSRTDSTHDPSLRSWVESANIDASDFPIQNLPFGVFQTGNGRSRIGVAIGDQILDLAACVDRALLSELDGMVTVACREPSLSILMALGSTASRPLRERVSELLRVGSTPRPELLVAMTSAAMQLPAAIGDYTDFYASIHHATNVGSMFRPDNPLLPNYKYVPIAYHGRASSIVISGIPVSRPSGQVRDDPNSPPHFSATRLLDYELEVGFFIGQGNPWGTPIRIGDAAAHLFGACVVNDWSARDIQSWEYQPLGPFLSKSFATTISPWVVTMDALAPFHVPAFQRAPGDPVPLPHLWLEDDQAAGGLAITLEVYLSTEQMRLERIEPVRLSRGNFASMYWTPAQMVAHHASNGCNLRPGDLIASGTVSGPEESERGCLLELTWRGTRPLRLPNGEERKFLLDGDEVIFRAFCERDGFVRIGFGECRGAIRAGA